MTSPALSPAVYGCVLVRPRLSTAEWAARHLQMPADSKLRGRFRLDCFPHVVEIFAAFDDPDVEKITFQTAAQVGKTTFSQACLAKTAATDPHPMAFADADEQSTRRVIARTWRLFERCLPLAELLPPRGRQSDQRMELTTCLIHGAWAGSASTAADYGAYVVVLNETDKMRQRSTDSEADFRYLMQERAKGYVGAKIMQISTPTLTGSSWIEAERLAGDNRRRLVPCPHCNHFQELRTGNGRDPGGVRFEKPDGKLDPQTARQTAWYECEACRRRIEEHHRFEMLNSGLWVPEGCHVDKRGRVAGKPARPGPHASFGPLSTLHSLLPGISIGRYAQEWVAALTALEGKRERIRNFVNSWEGNTWDPQPQAVQPSGVVTRLSCGDRLRVCPSWTRFLTLGADVGGFGDELYFYWVVCAWGLHARGQLIDLGLARSRDEMRTQLLTSKYPHADGGPTLQLVQAGVDSGSFTQSIYEFCRGVPGLWPIKGSSRNQDSPWTRATFNEMFQGGMQRAGLDPKFVQQKQKAGAYDLLLPHTQRSQDWIVERLEGRVKRDHANAFTIPAEAFGQVVPGVDLAKHLLGDYEDNGIWRKRYEDQDFRDALRYAVIVAWFYTANGAIWAALPPRGSAAHPPAPTRSGDQRGRRGGFVRQRSGGRR